MNPRKRDSAAAAKRDGDDFAERILEHMRENAAKKPASGVHLIGDRGVSTWCGIALAPGSPAPTGPAAPSIADVTIRGVIRIADVFGQASCEECVELMQMRRTGIANDTYKHPLDAKLDAELGVHRPPTMGT